MATVTYEYTGVGDPSTVRRLIDAAFDSEFPQDVANRDYQVWQAWILLGGVTDDPPEVTLADLQDAGKLAVAGRAAAAAAALTNADPRDALFKALRFAEALRWEDQSFTSPGDDAQAKLMEAEVGIIGGDIDEVHDAILTELATLSTALAAINAVHVTAVVAIDAADDQAEIDAAIVGAVFDS